MIDKLKKRLNKRNLIFMCLALLSIIYVVPIFWGGILTGDDVAFHLTRFDELCNAFKSGDLFPLIYEGMNSGQGYAVGAFYPAIFMYPFALLSIMGIPKVFSVFLYYATMNTITTFTMYKLGKYFAKSKEHHNPERFGIIFALISFLDFYRFINYYIRGALGEFSAFAFVPLVILYFYKILRGKNCYISFAISMALVFANHIITTVILCVTFLVLLLVNVKKIIPNPKILLTVLKAAGIFIIITPFIWVPMIEYLASCNLVVGSGINAFGSLDTFCMFKFNVSSAVSIIISLSLLVFSMIFTTTKARVIQVALFSGICITNLFCWSTLDSVLSFIQFPWRVLSIVFIGVTLYLLLIWENKVANKMFRVLTTFLMIGTVLINSFAMYSYFVPMKFANYITFNRINETALESYDNMGNMEYAPLELYENNKEIADKNGTRVLTYKYSVAELNKYGVFEELKDGETYVLRYNSLVEKRITVPRVYYPGCKAQVDGKTVLCKPGKYGFITVETPKLYGNITVWYEHTDIEYLSIVFTVFGAIVVWLLDARRRVLEYRAQQEGYIPKVRAKKVKVKKKKR